MTYINKNPIGSTFSKTDSTEEEAEILQNVLRNNKRKGEKNLQTNKRSKKTTINNTSIITNEENSNNESNDNNISLPKINLKNVRLSLIPNAPPPGSSWIWSYFDQFVPIPPYKRIVKCLVEVQGENGMKECGHIMGTDSSTGNFILHLASKHSITEETHKRKKQEIGENKKGRQQTITHMLRSNPAIKKRRDQKFIAILVKDQ